MVAATTSEAWLILEPETQIDFADLLQSSFSEAYSSFPGI